VYLYLVSVMPNDESLLQVFEPFGQVELVQLPTDPLTGLCKGYGFIQVSYSQFPIKFLHSQFHAQAQLLIIIVAPCSLPSLKMQRLHRA
jgi:hypothetical protein